ncbi:hypothetical protein C7H73_01145 [Pulveribacter suum]|uniref:Uncharacterized protein n=2 Tax=Pulveribacter suum TaxID=2116657 RepID=A0A2P1NHA2_9BURK|nr:hypothetical protein C7H73_01145 [Pulveribacter suum]
MPEGTDDAIPTPAHAPGTHAAHTFTLYAYRGRLCASNVRDKLIDLGTLAERSGSGWAFELDGEGSLGGSGHASAEQALAAAARSVTFLYLDGQFTAQRDLSDVPRPDLPHAPQVVVTLDPRGVASPVLAAD